MRWAFLLVFATASAQDVTEPPTSDPAPVEEATPPKELDDCQKGVESLKNDVLGLEFFLQDKKDYKERCPYTKWEQPKLEEYKREPKSYLPKNCKVEK